MKKILDKFTELQVSYTRKSQLRQGDKWKEKRKKADLKYYKNNRQWYLELRKQRYIKDKI